MKHAVAFGFLVMVLASQAHAQTRAGADALSAAETARQCVLALHGFNNASSPSGCSKPDVIGARAVDVIGARAVDPCVSWRAALGGVTPLALGPSAASAPSADDEAERLRANLAASLADPKAFARADACALATVPMLGGKTYSPKFYRTPEGVLWMKALLEYMGRLPKEKISALAGEMQAMKQFRADFDPSLVLAIAFRESNSTIFRGGEQVDSHRSGGLDFLGGSLGLMRKKYLPAGAGASWSPSTRIHNESGQACRPALLPAQELPMAYGAFLLMSRDEFKKQALKFGFTDAEIDAASPTARRAWTALTFAMSGGPEYVKGKSTRDKRNIPGTVTVLTRLRALMNDGKAKGLDDILTSPELQIYTNVRLALASAANAAIIEAHTGLGGDR